MKNIKRILTLPILSIYFAHVIGCNNNVNIKNDFDYVYTIECNLEGKQSHIGTCFYANGLFYTNAHLVLFKELSEYITADNIIAKDEFNSIEYNLYLKEYDLSNDFATLTCDVQLGEGLNIKERYEVKIGEDIFTIGNLNNYGLAYGYGKITSKEKTFNNLGNSISYVQTNIEISGGNSGGPVFNYSNEVIGIMSLKLVDNSNQYVDGASFFVKM